MKQIAQWKRFLRFVPKSKQSRDADGKRLCLVCDSSLPPRNTSYCEADCRMRNMPSWIAKVVLRRDNWTCQNCGCKHGDMEADHILPVSEGGGLCGPEGYRTLCKPCHGKESGKLRKRLAERRKIEKAQKETGRLFA